MLQLQVVCRIRKCIHNLEMYVMMLSVTIVYGVILPFTRVQMIGRNV